MDRAQVVVVILNWNRPHDTVECLRSLRASDYPSWRAIVVDNGSTDESVAIIQAACPEAEILVNEENLGFAAGTNVGIRRALEDAPRYVLLLNNDTEVVPATLTSLVAAAEERPEAGIVSPLILYADEERVWFRGSYRRRFWPGVSMPGYRRRRVRPSRPFPIDYATGCAMLLRGQMLEQIGLLDPAYFMYWEDLDLGERVRRAGWSILLVPAAVVRHRVSASTGEQSPQKWYYLGRYMPLFYRRYYRWPSLAMGAYAAWVLIREVVLVNWTALRPFARGVVDGWRAADSGTAGGGPDP